MENNANQIVIYHIGGEGGYGPLTAVLNQMRPHIRLVVFEARSDTSEGLQSETLTKDGIETTLILKGIDERVGRHPFYVNKYPLSSSLLPCSRLAENENPAYAHCHRWGQNAELDHVIEVETVPLDDIVDSGIVPPPDIISIDAQGAELRILRGAKKALSKTLCVVTEVEFFEIYDGQGLFDDQMSLLSRAGLRLFTIENQQNWHPGPAFGRGFLTVGEAVFFRYAADVPELPGKRGYCNIDQLSDEQLMRLAAIAISFHAASYAYTLGVALRDRNPALWEAMKKDPHYRVISDLVEMMQRDMPHYERDPLFFLKAYLAKTRSAR